MCGATRGERGFGGCLSGLSPRVWGNLVVCIICSLIDGPIPTCVGQPRIKVQIVRLSEAYPHVCGATPSEMRLPSPPVGLSPRVWGNPTPAAQTKPPSGPIPTCVGQPQRIMERLAVNMAYPHVCGATKIGESVSRTNAGLSPRVWGNPFIDATDGARHGPIPTCVGQPKLRIKYIISPPAYPHVCGATAEQDGCLVAALGLSPRVWGNLPKANVEGPGARPIPTCVGQPHLAIPTNLSKKAYPHVCGATSAIVVLTAFIHGLSPRVWGNRVEAVDTGGVSRPIPTCVGQPCQN